MPDVMTPAQIVTDAYNDHQGYAQEAFEQALQIVSALQDFTIPNITTQVSFDAVPDSGAPFEIPPAPDAPSVNLVAPALPAEPTLDIPAVPAIGDAPEFEGTRPEIAFDAKPDALDATPPGDAPDVSDVILPDAPVLAFPDSPTSREITLPDSPVIDLPVFSAVPPDTIPSLPAADFNYSETPYSSLLLSEVTAKVRSLISTGGFGIPPAIEQALFDRARVREDMTAKKAVQEATEEFSARGFSQPSGELARRVGEIRQKNQDAVNQLSREILLKASDVEIENLRFAVQQGIALESMLVGYASSMSERALRAAEITARLTIDYFNAQVQLFNAQVAAFGVQAEAYRTRLEGEKARIDIYRAQLDGARLIGELNKIDVELYAARIQALLSQVEVYKAQLSGVQTQVEVDKARIDAFRATVQAYAERVGAKKAEYDAWSAGIQGEVAKLQPYQTEAEVFASRVRGYAAGIEAQLAPVKLRIETNQLISQQYATRLQAFRETVNAQSQAAQSAVALYEGQARVYQAQVGAASAKSEADDRRFQLSIEQSRTAAQIALENSRSTVENAIKTTALTLEALKAQATVLSQIAAGALSAVNLGASISGSSSDSKSHGSSVSVGHSVPYAEQASTTGLPNMSYQ